ncbi:MAG TPA: alpha/beta fold hydrolase [Casimicrobiaceae bacterium]|jgi:triacylglycerol esterase/lipase EstA (alpha/beta hydrolase family)|nr:alpha/beta fold hydrolase [Casimicrobiaceae bacterium]
MTALLLFVALVAGAAAYVIWASYWIAQGAATWWFVVGAPVAYFAPAFVLVTLWFALAWIWRTPRPPEARLGFASTLRVYVTEIWTVAASWLLMVLHRLLIHDPVPAPAQRPVVLVHGVLVNDGVWLSLRRSLARNGVAPIYTINYGPPLADIEWFAEQLHTRIEAIRAATGAERPVLVAHSMGGLVARAYLRHFGAARVAKLITIGAPHHGSMLAWSFPGACLAQMRPGNAWLTDLNRDENRAGPVPITSIWSRHDSMVAPQASSVLGNAENIALVGIAHNALLGDERVMELVVREIAKAKSMG